VKFANFIQKRFATPFDFSQIVQTLRNPCSKQEEYITVQRVKLNISHFETNLKP